MTPQQFRAGQDDYNLFLEIGAAAVSRCGPGVAMDRTRRNNAAILFTDVSGGWTRWRLGGQLSAPPEARHDYPPKPMPGLSSFSRSILISTLSLKTERPWSG
jgi:hypothetical protein